MRDNRDDKTLERSYIQKWQFYLGEYELVKQKKHPHFRFVQDFYSPTDSYTEVDAKAAQLLEAGTLLVVLINPRTRTITLRHQNGETTTLTEADTLTLGDVLPGFECAVAELFV